MNTSNTFRVVIVEDSQLIRTSLTQRIEELADFSVVGYADTSEEALAKIGEQTPEIVILDLHLKKGTGYDVLARLNEAGGEQRPKLIVFTNFGSPVHRKRALALGAYSFFDKSMEFEEMLTSLQALTRPH